MQIQTTGEASYATFSAAVFTFIETDSTYLHCEVRLCELNTTQCDPQCGNRSFDLYFMKESKSRFRERRETTSDRMEIVELKAGPLILEPKRSKFGIML